MSQVITAIFPSDFRVRSKKDAETLLTKYVADAEIQIRDVDDKKYLYVIKRHHGKGKPADIARVSMDMEWYDPVLFYSGEKAIDMAFKARKSINRWLSHADD